MCLAFTGDMNIRRGLMVGGVVAATVSAAAYYHAQGRAEAPAYVTQPVVRGDVVDTVEASGTLGAVTTVQVGTQVSGTIASLHADFNSRVRKGHVIARLDPSLLEAQVEQAEATVVRLQAEVERSRVALDDARVTLRRGRELLAAGLVPAADVDAAESAVRQGEASLKAAEAQVTQAQAALHQNRVALGHTVITAPVDGVVISRNVDVGQTVAASMSAPTLFVIANDLSEMQVDASVDEADIGRVAPGQQVSFTVDAYPQEMFRGVVEEVRLNPVVQQNVVSYVTVIDVANPDLKLKPGMTANVTIEVAKATDVLKVPNAALRFQPPGQPGAVDTTSARAWTLESGQLQAVPVQLGITDGTTTAVVGGGLKERMPIVTALAAQNTGPAAAATSPLIPQPPRGNRGRSAGSGVRP